MITFGQHIQEISQAYKITDANQLASLKRWYRLGAKKVRAKLKREVSRERVYTNIDSGVATYQLPVYVGTVFGARYVETGNEQPLEEVRSEYLWNTLVGWGGASGPPSHFRKEGDNEIKVWPTPSSNVTNGLEVACNLRQSMLSADDVSTGTVTVAQGDDDIVFSTGSATTSMVGRWFMVTDGSNEYWYRIVEYVNSTTLRLENYYDGPSGAGRSYLVGDIVDIPEEAIELPALYAISKYLGMYRKSRALSKDMLDQFAEEIKELRQDFAAPGKSRVVKGTRHDVLNRAYPPWWPVTGLIDAP